MGSWRAIVLTRIDSLQCEVAALQGTADADDQAVIDGVNAMLTSAREAMSARKARLRGWWSGVWVERAWRCVHEAEALLATQLPLPRLRVGYPDVQASARHSLRPNDPRRTKIEMWLCDQPQDDGPTVERARYVAALRWTRSESDNAHARVRSFRNVVVITTLAMTLVALGLVLVGFLARDALPVCVEPTQGTAGDVADQPTLQRISPTGGTRPSRGDVPLVAFVGLVGAALASALAIRKIRGTSTPYSVPLALAVLKLPTGAVTALAGLLLIQGGFVPGLSALDDPAQVLSYSIILGFGQEAFTRLVDRQGQRILDNAPGRDQLSPHQADGELSVALHDLAGPVPAPAPATAP
jgi:hypothetical protein